MKITLSGKPFLKTDDGYKAFVSSTRDIIEANSKIILQSAQEIVRMAPFEDIQDLFWLNLIGRNVSVGVAQVKLETANGLIKDGLYNPNPDDAKLPFSGNLSKSDRKYLYEYVVEPKHNLRFAAAYIRSMIDAWSKYIDLSEHPEIIGTLYAQGYGTPKSNPVSTTQGDQIAEEFYTLAKKWLE